MAITIKNLIRHELIGLGVAVDECTNKTSIGTKGNVINETKKLLVIRTRKGDKKVQKSNSKFIFTLPNGKKVKVDGKRIDMRPEERIKARVKKW
ncbi:MAG: ribonuclease P protein component 1 [Candidatus Aenigmarchaeota archaeon]|nr:ribonuclease P protein component 1 [Candidatus Aenigmarchaeota archaeon]